jgi:5-(carboxyamino)imidazole ribonucleotide synthase
MIAPGAWLGVLGGGQLGMLFTRAAQRMGYVVMAVDPDPSCPAAPVADRFVNLPLDAPEALALLHKTCAAVTVETENAPAASLTALAAHCQVSPAGAAVAVAQDRIREKRFIVAQGLATAPFAVIERQDDLERAARAGLLPGLLKRSRFGYDGKGQALVHTPDQLLAAWADFDGLPCVLEHKVELRLELSVLLACGAGGETALWPVAENRHVRGVLDLSIVPARIDARLAQRARDAALRLAAALDYRGVLCVEFFVAAGGALLINEIAPRPHNSGHYTLDACSCSQFEQQVRALAGLPLGDTAMRGGAVMQNLLGDLWADGAPDWRAAMGPSTYLHLYGKAQARPGRKMGHYTCIADNVEEALQRAQLVKGSLMHSD